MGVSSLLSPVEKRPSLDSWTLANWRLFLMLAPRAALSAVPDGIFFDLSLEVISK
jgi:hypothetical protein